MCTPRVTDLIDQALQAERFGRFDEARGSLLQAVLVSQPPQAIDCRLRLAKLLISGGHAHDAEAEALLTTARLQAEQQGTPRQTATAIHLLALLERGRGRLDRALQMLDESPACQQATAPDPALGQLIHYRGLVEADRGNLNVAERLLFQAHQVYKEAHHDAGLAEVCDSLANLLLKRGKSQAALAFARMSLERKRELGDRFGEAITLGTLGRAYLLRACYVEAAGAFAQDLAIARELGDQRGIGIMLNSLGEVALLQKDLDTAASHYQDSLAEDRGPWNSIHAHLGLARVHLAEGRLDEAAADCDRTAALLDRNPAIHGLPDVLGGLRGAIAWRRGDLVVGERLLAEAIESLSRQNQSLDTIPFLYELRDLYQSRGDKARAVGLMARALDLLSECGAERGVEDVEHWLRSVDAPGLTRLALERHFPPWLVQDILGGRMGRPQSRRQTLAVLFCDVRDFTTLTEGLPPEQIVELLNEWFTEATGAIRRHGGVVDMFIGDAVMALFGVPEPRVDAAADAVRAALVMRDTLAAMNLRQQALGGKELRVGIGIDCGEAVVGFIGSHLRQSYTAIGDVVNTAARLESATKEHQCDILISGSVEKVQRSLGVADSRSVGELRLKGKRLSVPAYQVLGLLTTGPSP
jgi:class 3 adenylate cyclase/tetratricopeptide (TPR) repeat protein